MSETDEAKVISLRPGLGKHEIEAETQKVAEAIQLDLLQQLDKIRGMVLEGSYDRLAIVGFGAEGSGHDFRWISVGNFTNPAPLMSELAFMQHNFAADIRDILAEEAGDDDYE